MLQIRNRTRGVWLGTVLAGVALALAGCGDSAPAADAGNSDEAGDVGGLYEVGTLADFVTGDYQGRWNYGDIKQHGDFGLGTFDGINGELVALDGQFWQVRSDGTVTEVRDDQTAPYAQVLPFTSEGSVTIDTSKRCFKSLDRTLDAQLSDPDQNIHAFKIRGEFSRVKTRSIAKQTPPYKPFAQVQPTQSEFDLRNVQGTLVAIRFPAEGMTAFAAPGYHYHFITADHDAGGHVLACNLKRGTADFDTPERFQVEFPEADPSSGEPSRSGNE